MSSNFDISYFFIKPIKAENKNIILCNPTYVFHISSNLQAQNADIIIYGHSVFIDPSVIIKANNVYLEVKEHLINKGKIEANQIYNMVPDRYHEKKLSSEIRKNLRPQNICLENLLLRFDPIHSMAKDGFYDEDFETGRCNIL